MTYERQTKSFHCACGNSENQTPFKISLHSDHRANEIHCTVCGRQYKYVHGIPVEKKQGFTIMCNVCGNVHGLRHEHYYNQKEICLEVDPYTEHYNSLSIECMECKNILE